jgi:hypothetical protein
MHAPLGVWETLRSVCKFHGLAQVASWGLSSYLLLACRPPHLATYKTFILPFSHPFLLSFCLAHPSLPSFLSFQLRHVPQNLRPLYYLGFPPCLNTDIKCRQTFVKFPPAIFPKLLAASSRQYSDDNPV